MAERDNEERLERLADSVLDGGPVDWADAESSIGDAERGVVRQLRLVSAIASVHRTAGSEASPQVGLHPPFSLPARWGPLELRELVGRGSFGNVYRGWDLRLDREVALKLLHRDDGAEASSAVIAEGRLLARVRHRNVVTIHGADRIDGRVGLWMEFVRGETLERLLAERGAFGPQEALLVGIDLCRALSAVHQAGVVHRDIKAQNAVREEGGRIVLMDFGTGRDPSLDGADPTLSGTPLYLAPELFKGEPTTRQSDIYSLGVLLFHLVSRSYPVSGRSVGEIRAAHRDGRRSWLRDLRPDLPERFIQTIEPALAVDPRARYQSAGEMEQALLTALSELEPGSPIGLRSPPGTRAVAPDAPRRARAIWLAAGGLTAVALIGSLIVAPRVLNESEGQTSDPPAARIGGTGEQPDLTARRVSLPPTMFVGRPSPDGRYLSYVNVNGDLCLQDFAAAQSRCLTSKGQSEERGESEIAISPDGKGIAYSWHTLDGTNEIRLVSEDGAWPRLLFRQADIAHANPLQWSPDGTEILTLLETASGDNQLVFLSAADGAVKPLRTLSAGQEHPALSIDGALVAFEQRQDDDPRRRDIFVFGNEDASAAPHPVVEHPANDVFPMWASDGRLLFVSDRTGSLGLWALRIDRGRPAGEPELLVRDIGRLAMPLGLTADGALYYYLQNGMVDVFTQTIDLAGATTPGRPQPAAPTLIGSNISSQWSPDGRYLAYVSIRGLVDNDRYSRALAILDTTTDTRRNLQLPLSSFIETRWSPDGRTILVRGRDLQNREGIFGVAVDSGETKPAILFPAGTIQSAVFQWSPDGKAIWYDKTGARAIVAQDLATGRERVVLDYSTDSVHRLMQWPGFRLSPDGTSVAYTGFTFVNNVAGTVVLVRTLGGQSLELARATSPERVEFQDWTPDGQSVLLIKRNVKERRNMLYEVRLDGSPPRPLGVTMEAIRDVSFRRDGQAITYTAGASSLEVWVLERFLTSAGARQVER